MSFVEFDFSSIGVSVFCNNKIWRNTIAEEKKEVKLKPLEFEDIWVASRVEPLMDNFDILGTFQSY